MDSLNLNCHICGHPVTIANCAVDENGNTIHEECYGQELLTRLNKPSIVPANRKDRDEIVS